MFHPDVGLRLFVFATNTGEYGIVRALTFGVFADGGQLVAAGRHLPVSLLRV